jgi:hypothetical protein
MKPSRRQRPPVLILPPGPSRPGGHLPEDGRGRPIRPPPRTRSPWKKTADCPGVTARWGSRKRTRRTGPGDPDASPRRVALPSVHDGGNTGGPVADLHLDGAPGPGGDPGEPVDPSTVMAPETSASRGPTTTSRVSGRISRTKGLGKPPAQPPRWPTVNPA